jgi:hypothetical protein
LGPNLSIRVWDGGLAPYHSFLFDFVNAEGQYVCPPKDIGIHVDGVGQILSIEESIQRERNESQELNKSMELGLCLRSGHFDPNWETYIVPEGVRLRIRQEGQEDCFLDIPTRDSQKIVLHPMCMHQV